MILCTILTFFFWVLNKLNFSRPSEFLNVVLFSGIRICNNDTDIGLTWILYNLKNFLVLEFHGNRYNDHLAIFNGQRSDV